ncbi:MAG: GlxA family transcriptional regulator [Catenulispora sp.]
MQRIAVLALPGVSMWELGAMTALFGSAGGSECEVVVCSADGGPVQSDVGVTVFAQRGLDYVRQADTVAIPSAAGPEASPGLRAALSPSALRPGARLAASGTAVRMLAALGLLDGRTVTTTWPEAGRLAAEYPRVRVDPCALFVDDGDVLTSAGSGAVGDLCLHLIRRDRGDALANDIARRNVVPPRRQGGQSLYIPPAAPGAASGSTAATRAWAWDRLGEPMSLARMAGHARMSIRTFARRFRAETGTSPGNWLIRQRVEYARRLLETTDLPVESLAPVVGFGSTESLRKQFRRVLGVGPQSYRFMFGRRCGTGAGLAGDGCEAEGPASVEVQG